MFDGLFYKTIRMECQKENEENWDGESTSVLDQTTLGIDGHDKLKPLGFSLHGCIDGFSRRLIWLEVSSSNKKQEIIGKFYLDAVRQLQSIPKKLKRMTVLDM